MKKNRKTRDMITFQMILKGGSEPHKNKKNKRAGKGDRKDWRKDWV